jgi:hypothetical protein
VTWETFISFASWMAFIVTIWLAVGMILVVAFFRHHDDDEDDNNHHHNYRL